ncbi:DNA repair protein [Histidinibacterium aquaticum]|uniref:DNA repair protein n=1 Tax=Histidinibacterium aquaticum TaxID=2613962 RepID=A0A5J5GC79_9RHOB|nr:DNA repair protein [Histidinibacterium aquaticum]KAA9005607.1 DNA repair protein [Histidinibacterium aquaticum]
MLRGMIGLALRLAHLVAVLMILFAGLAALAYTIGSALGYTPWLALELQVGNVVMADAGMWLQIAATALIVSLLFFLPASGRVLALERGHRDFRISMEDVARAYHYCHHADRRGVFTMSSEFDQVRERISFLRDHPDLQQLEPQVMEVAAQMSQQSRELAEVYSDDKVRRAKEFLAQRQEEAETQQARIVEALHACTEIRKWRQQVEVEESIVASQLEQLQEQLDRCLPDLGLMVGRPADNVTPLQAKTAAE